MSTAICQLCGEPMPSGEEMFNYHGYSGPCPKHPKSVEDRSPLSVETARRDLVERVAMLCLGKDDPTRPETASALIDALIASVRAESAPGDQPECAHGHKERKVGCVSCVLLFAERIGPIDQQEIERLKRQLVGHQSRIDALRSIATILGWGNIPPLSSLERSVVSLRERAESAEAELARLRAEQK